ncbi:hypothetical protein M378DRAFT_130340 [Amanita muscaria Koide BX008]|uniref:NAD-dependent epimerase/dehydratase domain-containing protein n=1 Tax=Amanita muscaria (strain Koide BX008) TaxID=946122 RepID=A0A0C2SCT1_AMAMK|nr:hypothetical protein M378DRAFT_130340 [Amanita muscaria Koide BX008]
MPVVLPAAKVLVSGASGYIAAWLVRTLLQQGYSVRGTARSKEKGAFLLDLFKSYGDKFEFVVVEDMTKEGAFDEAVKGIDAIQHTASPFHFNADDPKELIDPAVNGTIGILKSALKNAPDVKRITVLASCACVLRVENSPHVFSENDWNDQSIVEVESLGRKASPMAKYRASKTLAEKAAWAFHRDHEKEVNWDLVVINPPFVFGPVIHPVATLKDLNTSAKEWYDVVVAPGSSGRTNEQLATLGSCWVDVRDLASALSLTLVVAEAGNERIIVSAGAFHWQDWLDAANSLSPSPFSRPLPVGAPGAGKNVPHKIDYDTSKERKILKVKYKTIEESTKDTLADFESRGW